ncbi:MAG: ABC transporter permease, partial [Spirochaetaceae bacterium]
MIIFKIALRNLREHKVKTLIIGILIATGITLLVAGNSFLDTITAGLRATYSDNYTGDLIIHGKADGNFSLFGIMGLDMGNTQIPELEPYIKIRDLVAEDTRVIATMPLAVNPVSISIGEDTAGAGILWGIDPDEYAGMFTDNLVMHEGSMITGKRPGILLSKHTADTILDETGIAVHAGDMLRLSGMNPVAGTRIREVTVEGIFYYKQTGPQLERVSLVNISTLRELSGMDIREVTEADLSDNEKALLGEINEEDLFGTDSLVTMAESKSADILEMQTPGPATEQIAGIKANGQPEAWHFLLLKTGNETTAANVRGSLEAYIADKDLELEVSGWQWGAGFAANMALSLQLVFNIAIMVIFIVALIIIMNTLVISITERIPEIGTIRAIGGQKGSVRRMITTETLLITLLFGTAGIILGSLVIAVFGMTGIKADNMFMRVLFGWDLLRPVLSASSV